MAADNLLGSESTTEDLCQNLRQGKGRSAGKASWLGMSAIALAGSFVAPLSAEAQVVNLLQNGGFETNPGVNNPPGFRQFTSNNPDASKNPVPFWTNNAPNDNTIEIWRSGFQGVNAITQAESAAAQDGFFPTGGGIYFNELNSKAAGRLSQSVNIKSSGVLSYSFWSRGRSGTDTMRLEIQENVNGTWKPIDAQTINGSAANTAWVNHKKSDFLIVTPGEYRFEFVEVTSAGSASFGNFLDNIAIGFLDTTPGPGEIPNPFVPEPAPVVPGQPAPPAPPAPPLDLTAGEAEEILAETIGAALEPEAVASGFFPRNTDAAPAGMQRYLNNSSLAILTPDLDQWPQQIPICKGSELNSRRYQGSAAQREREATYECVPNYGKRAKQVYTFADDSRDYYGYRTGLRAWVKGYSSNLTNINNPSAGNWVNRADVRGGGGLLGVETSLTTTTQLGIYGNAGNVSVNQSGLGGGSWSPSAYGVGVYGRWSPGPYFLGALAGYGNFSGTQSRGIDLEDGQLLTASGNKTANAFTTAVSAGTRLRLGKDTLLTPSAYFGWSNINENGYKETGGALSDGAGSVGVFDLNYASHTTNWSNLDLGATLSQVIRSGTTLVIPSARVSWFGDYKSGGGDQVINYTFAPQNISVPGGWLNRNGVRLALGFDVTTNQNTSLYLRGTADFGYDGRGGGAIADYGVNGGLMVRFGGPRAAAVTRVAQAAEPLSQPIPAPEPAPAPVRGLW